MSSHKTLSLRWYVICKASAVDKYPYLRDRRGLSTKYVTATVSRFHLNIMKTYSICLASLLAIVSVVYALPTIDEDDTDTLSLLQGVMQSDVPQAEDTDDQQSVDELEEAMEEALAQEQTDSTTATTDDIIALLQGEDITMESRERAEIQSLLSTFNSGLQTFMNRMNTMIRRYTNYFNCLPKMEAEMQRSDAMGDEELVKEMVHKLANIQGQQKIRRLFQRIRQFITNTRNRGTRLYREIQTTLASVFRGYTSIVNCIRRYQG